jgi:hypothetical protein
VIEPDNVIVIWGDIKMEAGGGVTDVYHFARFMNLATRRMAEFKASEKQTPIQSEKSE